MDGASNGGSHADAADDSPPVIAIDDDDDDDDADRMTGYATAASFHVEFDADAHMAMFPFAHNGDCIYAAQEIARYFHTSESRFAVSCDPY
jgi:ubiquitin carboxyl-terminal hydrolase 34